MGYLIVRKFWYGYNSDTRHWNYQDFEYFEDYNSVKSKDTVHLSNSLEKEISEYTTFSTKEEAKKFMEKVGKFSFDPYIINNKDEKGYEVRLKVGYMKVWNLEEGKSLSDSNKEAKGYYYIDNRWIFAKKIKFYKSAIINLIKEARESLSCQNS